MADLTLHGRPIATVFNLLGANEDDITYSLGWALSQSERLARAVLADVFDTPAGEIDAVRLQEVIPGAGRIDVEIEAGDLHLIVEAKRGWNLPSSDQLELYAPRFATSG